MLEPTVRNVTAAANTGAVVDDTIILSYYFLSFFILFSFQNEWNFIL